MGGKVRYDAAHPTNDNTETFSLLFPQGGTEVLFQEGDYLVKTGKGLEGKSKVDFDEEYGIIENEQMTDEAGPEQKGIIENEQEAGKLEQKVIKPLKTITKNKKNK